MIKPTKKERHEIYTAISNRYLNEINIGLCFLLIDYIPPFTSYEDLPIWFPELETYKPFFSVSNWFEDGFARKKALLEMIDATKPDANEN